MTNNKAYAKEFGNKTQGATKTVKKQMKEKQDEEQRLKKEEEDAIVVQAKDEL